MRMNAPQPEFRPGVRLSGIDVFVLLLGTVAVFSISPIVLWLGFAIGFVVAHFFLFCNVFRISRTPELIWASLYLTLAISTLAYEQPGWLITTLIMVCISAVLIAVEMRKPSYHGIGWRRINPGLRDWWQANVLSRGSA